MVSNTAQAPDSTAVNDEPLLTADELKCIARLLNELMEVDFYLNRHKQEKAND